MDADLRQICLRSSTCPRSDSFVAVKSSADLFLPLAEYRDLSLIDFMLIFPCDRLAATAFLLELKKMQDRAFTFYRPRSIPAWPEWTHPCEENG